MYEKAHEKETIWRWGQKAEKLEHLDQLCSEAYDLISLFGVTAFSSTVIDDVTSTVSVNELRKHGFEVYITPIESTPEHRTITFPQPITPETVNCWNKLWKKQ